MNSQPYNLKIILLAGGNSERFNAIKLLAKVKKGLNDTPLIQHVINNLTASLTLLNIDTHNLQVATGNYHQQLSDVIGDQCRVNYCSQAHLGLGHTIAQSVESIINRDEKTSHIMITLGDQIALTAEDYARLIKQSLTMKNKLVCAKSALDFMPPAIFPHQYFIQLMALTGDKGAKALLYNNKANLQAVLLPKAIIDIDTEQDLINWHKS